MGGNALVASGVTSVRLGAEQYVEETNKIIDSLTSKGYIVKLVAAYRNKESFGDADILVSCHNSMWGKLVNEIRASGPHYINGKVASYGHTLPNGEIFQVDLIYCGETLVQMNTEMDYYSYNDLGNLVGRLAHLHGLKYGHKGLTYTLRDPEDYQQVVDDITVSTTTEFIHKFLDLDHDRYLMGFDTLEDIFKWVSASKWFHPEIYLLENVNAVSRVRDRKRATYNKFLEWNEALDPTKYVKYEGNTKAILRKYSLHTLLQDPVFNQKYNNAMVKFYKWRLGKEFFNGDLVKELTGKTGKELGVLMRELKEQLTTDVILADPLAVKGKIIQANK